MQSIRERAETKWRYYRRYLNLRGGMEWGWQQNGMMMVAGWGAEN